MPDFLNWLKDPHLGTWWYAHDIVAFTPPAEWKLLWAYVGFTVLCWIGGFAIHFLRIHPNIQERLTGFLWTNAVVGTIILFFRIERVPLLGMDLWRTLQLAGDLIWLILLIRYLRGEHGKVRLEEKVKAYKNKYLPH